ncbi:hypothetical protein GAYE_SCF62G6562 [Galdieria yellowstonensis]|jgi:hypothetical protein|uniref:Uncharacterized protein n=1 Tax=Galdieria yellowstonensis TaxID=3028027 RepID=A0AAV9IMU3_9RHOD|nr:hypothetical protein GAYE_SCF62G6562 [Galdieria yellowstonensis]
MRITELKRVRRASLDKTLMEMIPWQTKQAIPDEEDLGTSYYWEQIAHTFTLLHHIQEHPNDEHALYLLRFSLDTFYGVQSFLFIYLRDRTLSMADKRPFPSLSVVLHHSARLLPRYLIRELIKVAAVELYYRKIEDEEQEELARLAKTRASLLSSSIRCVEMESEIRNWLLAIGQLQGPYTELLKIYELDSEQLDVCEGLLSHLLKQQEYYRGERQE